MYRQAVRVTVFVLLLWPAFLSAQNIDSHILSDKWQASWISHPTASRTGFGVFHFRRIFTLEQQPDSFIVQVSADNRYRLFVNGTFIRNGPARGDIDNWRFETVDLAAHLKWNNIYRTVTCRS